MVTRETHQNTAADGTGSASARAVPDEALLTSDFDYELPEELIPDRPRRGHSRLMVLPAGAETPPRHVQFRDLPDQLRSGDLLVFNDTRVLRARIVGRRLDGEGNRGGRVEALFVEPSETTEAGWWAMLRPGKRQRPGQRLDFAGEPATVLERDGDLFHLRFENDDVDVEALLEAHGELPLPPYLGRHADAEDDTDYQTVWAAQPGAVAAPTAGLHFDHALLEGLSRHEIDTTSVTLHVGPGTFRPVKTDRVDGHRMDGERFHIDAAAREAIEATRARGGRVIAVGTTVVRTLEGAWQNGRLPLGSGRTDLFIRPGHRFRVVDGLITNFHLPRSTLIMLVAALVGRQRILDAYDEAVRNGYRFYSYGDAMLIEPQARLNDD